MARIAVSNVELHKALKQSCRLTCKSAQRGDEPAAPVHNGGETLFCCCNSEHHSFIMSVLDKVGPDSLE